MYDNANGEISRRGVLISAAIGSAAVISGQGILGAVANEISTQTNEQYWTKARTERYLCSQIHEAKANELAGILSRDDIDIVSKNKAVSSATCPCCNVRISSFA